MADSFVGTECCRQDGTLLYSEARIEGYDIVYKRFSESYLESRVEWFFGGVKVLVVDIQRFEGRKYGSALIEFTEEDHNFSALGNEGTFFADTGLFQEGRLVMILSFAKFAEVVLIWRMNIKEGGWEEYKTLE